MRITLEQRQAWQEGTAQSPFNKWLNAKVRTLDGGLDLERLHNIARRYGIDRQAAYSHLNPGQQRMSIGNLLRRVVPVSDYEGASNPPPIEHGSGLSERTSAIRTASVRDLLLWHSQILAELKERRVVRTANAPSGDYAELLFQIAFGWELQRNSAIGYDAKDSAGIRYQIKGRRITPWNPSRQLSALRKLPDQAFDFLAGVLFDETYQVTKAILIPHALVLARAKRVDHINGWRFILDDRIWLGDGVRDVTRDLTQAANGL